MAEILGYGVIATPDAALGRKVVHAAGIPGPDQVRAWVRA
jgi:hypothetical protein